MRTRHIVVDSSYASIWRDLMEGISLFVRESRAPWQLHCADAREFRAALDQRPDGILSVLPRADRHLLQLVKATRTPAVNMLRDVTPALPSVTSDNHAIGTRAAEYLMGRGFRHFAFVGAKRDWSTHRREGLRQRLARDRWPLLEPPAPISVQDLRAVDRRRVLSLLKRWAADLPRPVGIVAASDFIARAVLDACLDAGLKVPEHAAILGVDNDLAVCEFSSVPLSSIPQNYSRIGFEAARLLDGLISGRRRPARRVLIPPREVVPRRSTDIIAVADPLVARALEFIHHHAPRGGPQIQALLTHVGASRQWLDRRFKASLGRTPAAEIHRLRLDLARALLTETRLNIHNISHRCGFSHPENFCRFFRDATGIPPSACRETIA